MVRSIAIVEINFAEIVLETLSLSIHLSFWTDVLRVTEAPILSPNNVICLTVDRKGPNKVDQCIHLVTSNAENSWKDTKIIMFDAPQATDKPYIQRLELLEKSKSLSSRILIIVIRCLSSTPNIIHSKYCEVSKQRSHGQVL
jgi:hypothetical protein